MKRQQLHKVLTDAGFKINWRDVDETTVVDDLHAITVTKCANCGGKMAFCPYVDGAGNYQPVAYCCDCGEAEEF